MSSSGIEMAPLVHGPDRHLRVRLEHQKRTQHYYGIAWNKEVKDRGAESKATATLEEIRRDLGPDWKESAPWWLKLHNLDCNLEDKKYLLRVSRDETFPHEIGDAFIELFEKVKGLVAKANAELAG